ncbi:MAG TPA: hypothetical protein VEH27_03580 [Methylomirabilota bacterium]|nr:hypothetical protein [Methylomirabilota bacterium]
MKHLVLSSLAASALALGASGQDQAAQLAELQKTVKKLQEELETIKEGPKVDPETKSLMGDSLFKSGGLKFGFYGEAKYRFPQAGANTFDPHRFVLTPSYQINDWLVFNSELELEHGAMDEVAGLTGRSRFDGELELEQFYVDILLNEHFNIRSLGIDLVPVGRINKFHEPTVFYSTERPELYREIIPSTWFEPSMGVWGSIVEGLNYQLMVSTGLEDYSGSDPTAPGVTARGGMRGARPRIRASDENNLAYSGRLSYNGLPGLDASTSFYYTTTRGLNNSRSDLALFDIEAIYKVANTGLELRGDFAYWHIGDPQNLLVNNNAALNDDVGDQMYGWYTEAAYHFWPENWKEGRSAEMDLVPFVRYSQITTQSGLMPGSVEIDDGTANKDFLTIGLAYFLNSNFVVKGDYRKNLNGSTVTERRGSDQDYFQLGAGVFF